MKWICNIIVFIIATGAFSQELSISINKEKILIGEPFTLTLQVTSHHQIDHLFYAKKETIFPAKSSLNHNLSTTDPNYDLEILEPFSDSSYQDSNQYVWQGKYQLTGWDSAYVVIHPEQINIDDSLYFFPAGLIHIVSPVVDPSQPIYDINETFTELPLTGTYFLKFLQKNAWWLALLFLGILGTIYFLIKRKRKAPEPLNLREETLKQINLLEKGKGYESNLKEYYFDLSLLLRKFFAAHYQEHILDKTSNEISKLLADYGLNKELILLSHQLLTQSDMVKFAQSKPSLMEIQNITNDARKIVNEISDLKLNDE